MSGKPLTYPLQKTGNALLFLAILGAAGFMVAGEPNPTAFAIVAGGALLLGVLLVIPIGGADMPVVISLLNSYSGVAAAATGFVLYNYLLIVAGALVGASGLILTRIMCKAMNRSLGNVIFGAFGAAPADAGAPGAEGGGVVQEITAEDTAILLSFARSVIIIPGYGLAVAQAQHQLRDLVNELEAGGVSVKYAVHPVAGRMPGHLNVILSDAGVEYDALIDMDEANLLLPRSDVAIVIGANDVVNPAANNDPASPLYGMPVINAEAAKTVIIVKRSMSPGFAGVDNPLFYGEGSRMLFGDAKAVAMSLLRELKTVRV
jgi:NAD(P) transhydrogenase subunit beta